jgi:predicted nuclease of restriction endonuclease-like RecB superfamily
MSRSISVKQDGVIKTVDQVYVRDAGIWHNPIAIYIKQSGVWSQVYPSDDSSGTFGGAAFSEIPFSG